MSDLQTTYYIIGIIFMSLMLLIGLAALVSIFVIRAKVVAIQNHIEDRLSSAIEWAQKGEAMVGALKKVGKKVHK